MSWTDTVITKERRDIRELIIDVVAEAGRVDNSKRDANAVLLEFYRLPSRDCVKDKQKIHTDVDGLDTDALFNVGRLGAVRDFVGQDLGLA